MSENNSIVAVYPSHTAAETAVKELQQSGFDMKTSYGRERKQRMKTILCGMITAVLAFPAGTAMAQASGTKRPEAGPAPVAGLLSEAGINAPDISLSELKQALADKAVVLLDCNGSKTYANGHIPGALDFDGARADLARRLPKDKAALVVAYCGGPKCMAYKAGAEAAIKLGYTNVKHFSGGISGWKEAGEAVETAVPCPKCGRGGMTKGCPGCSATSPKK